jgi:hypothetical protein
MTPVDYYSCAAVFEPQDRERRRRNNNQQVPIQVRSNCVLSPLLVLCLRTRRWSATWKLGLACHNALSTSLAYFNLLATGYSTDLSEGEAELGMTEGNKDKAA